MVLFFGVLLGTSCYADNANSDGINLIVQVLDVVFAMITAVMTPAVILAGWLLSPDWTMGDFFGLRKYFLNVWILVSNLVYIAFALILLFMAVMQIFQVGESEYAFKQRLPRFLVGILMVPFTWLIVSWTLSFANQATAAVLSIPMGAIAQMQDSTAAGEDKWLFHEKVIPTKISIDLTKDGSNKSSEVDCKHLDGNSTWCISAAEFVANNGSGPYFIMMVYAYDIFKIQKTALVDLTSTCKANVDVKGCIKNLTDVLIKFGTALITTFFFGVLTIALCWVLLMRAFKLWAYVMFSPLFWIAYFTWWKWWGEALGSEGGGGESSGLASLSFFWFFQLAMVPVMVSGVLAFGLLFIGVISQSFSASNMTSWSGSGAAGEMCTASSGFMVRYCITPSSSTAAGNQGYTSRLIIGSDPAEKKGDYVPITFEFGGMFSGFVGDSATNSAIGAGQGVVDSVESVFAHIILTLIALVVIWVGVKTAVSYDEVTRVAFEPFAKMGESVQHFVSHIPSYIPTPHPAFKALTPAGMGIASEALNKVTEKFDEKFIHGPAKSLWELLSSPGVREWVAKLDEAGNDLNKAATALNEIPRSQLLGTNLLPRMVDKFTDALEVAASKASGPEKDRILKLSAEIKKNRTDQSALNDILSLQQNKETLAIAKTKDAGAEKVITKVENTLGSSSSSSWGDSFKTHKIDRATGAVTNSWWTTVTNATHLTENQREDIKKAFIDEENIDKKLDKSLIKDKLEHLGFSKDELDKIADDPTAKKVATNLLKAAKS